MKVEIILLIIIGSVFLIDFLIKAVKKKPASIELDVKKEGDSNFENSEYKPKKIINLSKLIILFIIGILFSLVGSYLVSFYYGLHSRFVEHFYLDDDLIYIIQRANLINSLIFFSIYLILCKVFWRKIKLNYFFVLKYFSKRKKNITLVILTIPLIKVFIHYFFYPKTFRNRTLKIYETKSVGAHIDVLFEEELILFIPSIIIVLFVAWFFNDKIKAR